jgi:ThiF family
MSSNGQNVDYSLQQRVNGLVIPESVTVVGTGGFGAWAAFFAALAGVKKLLLFDPGKVDGKDVARGPFTHKQIGTSKVASLRNLIMERRPNTEIRIHERKFELSTDEHLLVGTIFEGVSDQNAMEGISEIAKQKNIPVISGAYYGLDGYVFAGLPRNLKVPSEDAPVWVGATALSGLLAIYSAFVKPFSFVGRIDSVAMDANQVEKAVGDMLVNGNVPPK